MQVKPRRPSGFQEYTTAEQIEFNRLLDIIRRTYEKYGFAPLDTPDIELTEVLLAGSGGETSKQVYRFKREGSDTDLTLRYDLTVPLARYVAEHQNDLAFPFRRYQIGKVHRAERAQAGRFREFYQCDIDVIGSSSPVVDAEFPAIINEIFEAFEFGEFVVRLNNRMILNGYFGSIGVSDKAADVLRIVDKIEKISHDEFVAELQNLGLSDEQVHGVVEFTSITGTTDEVMAKLGDMAASVGGVFAEGVEKLRIVIETLRMLKMPEHRFAVDLHIARGLDYYTGTVYETFLTEHPGLGSVCSGGRYDNLTKFYTNGDFPGVGISIGLSRLFSQLREIGVVKAVSQSPAQLLVLPVAHEDLAESIAVAAQLREAGISVLLYSDITSVGKGLAFANKMGFAKVALIGEAERAAGKVSLKDMQSGDAELIAVADVVSTLRSS